MKCKLNNKCEFGDLCQQATRHDSITVLGCSSYKSKKPLTNEEWLKKANTEQLAEFLADKCNEVVEVVLSDASCDIGDVDNDDYWYRQVDFVEWLKQPHGEGVKNE